MEYEQLENLVLRVQNKEPGALEQLYETYKDEAYRTALFLTGNEADAQDAVQDVFMIVFRQIYKLRQPMAFRSWFYRILTNHAVKAVKKKNREIPMEEPQEIYLRREGADYRDLSENVIHREQTALLREAVRQLDDRHRAVVVLYYYNGFSVEEIAKILNCMTGTVKSRLYHARKQLKDKLTLAEGGWFHEDAE